MKTSIKNFYWVPLSMALLMSFVACENEPRPRRAVSNKPVVAPIESAGAHRIGNKRPDSVPTEPEEETELAIVLNPNLDLKDVPDVMRDVVTDLAHQFPGTTFVAVAYMPTNPPRRVCSARFDAQTGKATFKWEVHHGEEPLEHGVMRI
jgi:hypothetical protein